MTYSRQEELISGLYDIGALRVAEEGYVLHSGNISPIVYHPRPLVVAGRANSYEIKKQMQLRRMVVDAYSDRIDSLKVPYDHLYSYGGFVQAAIASFIAFKRNNSVAVPSPGAKLLYDPLREPEYLDSTVLQICSELPTVNAQLQDMEILERYGIEISGFVAMFDPEETVPQDRLPCTVEAIAVMGLSEVVGILSANSKIEPHETEWIAKYLEGLPIIE